MSFELPTQRTAHAYRSRWSGAAFLVEAMLLLVFVMASLAVFTQLFAASAERSNQSKDLTEAVAIATATAERFAADPHGISSEFMQDGKRVVCHITQDDREGGILWHATIQVFAPIGQPGDASSAASVQLVGDGPLYSLTTSVYESGV